ncbi:hypothetical protein MKX01_016849 [Papaver californicum]|nr:hypothetical protein MKX01_016849 [Papaver californicum]
MKSSNGEDSEEDEDDHYDTLQETNDEAESKGKKIGNVDNVPVRNVDNGQQWFNASDFEDSFAADLVDPELFPEPNHEVQVVDEDRIEEGLEFPDKAAFQKHLRKHCVSARTVSRFTKGDNIRVKAVCKGFGEPFLCPWYISARVIHGEPTWGIRDFHLHHTCIGDRYRRNSCANPEFVAQHVIEKLKESHGKTVP